MIELTPAGRALVRRARVRKIDWIARSLADLSPATRAALHQAATSIAVDAVIRRAEDGSYQPRRRPCEVTTDGEVICDRLYVGASDDNGRRRAGPRRGRLGCPAGDLQAHPASPSSPRAGDRRRRRRGPE